MKKTLYCLVFGFSIALEMASAAIGAASNGGNEVEEKSRKIKEESDRKSVENYSNECWRMYSEWQNAVMEEQKATNDDDRLKAWNAQNAALVAWQVKQEKVNAAKR